MNPAHPDRNQPHRAAILPNIIAGLTVSFVAISLGAAFGVLSGRGAFAGMLSAGLIAVITSGFGGTRVQCSGPTAPMTAVTALLVGVAHDMAGADSDRFINLVLVLSGIIVVLLGVLRLGRFIRVVPRVVVSGFMNGIAILIWVNQFGHLSGIGGSRMDGSLAANVGVAALTLALALTLPGLVRRLVPALSHFFPATLIVILALSAASAALSLNVESVALGVSLQSWADFRNLLASQLPTDWSPELLGRALPLAAQLAMLCYLDTLLTSIVMDKLSGETTQQDRELAAQGIANSVIAFVGGIPGAQATIRSVLILKEGATLRLAGILVGVFVLVEMLVLQDLIGHIPLAVLSGILFKVGYDVFDWRPVGVYLRGLLARPVTVSPRLRVGHHEMAFILVTTAVTVLWNLNVAVIGATIVFHTWARIRPIDDLAAPEETAGIRTED